MNKRAREQGIRQMLADIQQEVALTRHMIGRDALDRRVMQAMQAIPRDLFVPLGLQVAAYANGPLPIGHGQTISQPYIVALMSDLLAVDETSVVLEIGTGSGYQTAVLSRLCKKVYSIDLIPALARRAAEHLHNLGIDNVEIRSGNGYQGWSEHAPFDGIIVTAAAPYIPQALLDQLKPSGRLVIPIGQPHMTQQLTVVRKQDAEKFATEAVLSVAFVPLIDRDVIHDG